jgi:glycosyltransferase involved in cell wall biosynthesis
MNIIIVGPVHPWRGGIAHHTAMLADHLKSRHHVEVVTFSRQYPAFLFPGKSQYEQDGSPPDVRIHQWIDSMNPLSWISAAVKIRNMKPDVLLFAYSLPFFGPCYGILSAIVRWKAPTKALFLCHNIIPHERWIGNILFTKFAFLFSDYFIVQSAAVEEDLLKLIPRAKYAVVPHPVYAKFGSVIPKDEARRMLGITAPKVLLYFGYVRPYKGLATLIDALKIFVASEPNSNDVLLLIVGEFYDDEARYRARVNDLQLARHVVFVSEYVPNERVATYFSAADVVVLPYLSATQSGIAQIAYNFDKPIIATDVGGLAEVVIDEKTGFIVAPNDHRALAESISRFYKEGREEEFSAHVKEEKKKYSWDRLVDAIEDLACAGHHSP